MNVVKASNRDFTKIIREGFEFHKITDAEATKTPVLVLPVKKKGDSP
ncbi:MAG: hypothetical protein ACWGNI_04530 [Desulfobacterales bacterium]